MALEDKVQQFCELLLEGIRQQTEQEVRGFVSELLTVAAAAGSTSEPAPAEPKTDEILGRVLDGMRRLDQATRLTDALDTLAAVFTVRADRVRGWRFVGFGPTLDEARQVDLMLGEAGIVGRAVVTGAACSTVSGANGVPGDAEPAFTTLPLGVHALAVPVLVGGQVMAVVYGDDAERRPGAPYRTLSRGLDGGTRRAAGAPGR